jgi:putative membrane fusion protein
LRAAVKIISVLLFIFLIWNIYVFLNGREKTTLAVYGTISDYVSADGHLIKDETLIKAPSDGVLQPYVSDCEKIGRGRVMAAVLNGETDEAARLEMIEVKSRIAALESVLKGGDSFKDDILSIDTGICENISNIVKYASKGKMTNISKYKNGIVILADKRNALVNKNGDKILAGLKARHLELEAKLGNIINEITSPVSGVFTARMDGLEDVLTPERINELTVSDIEKIKNAQPGAQSRVSKGDAVCKLIDNFEWHLAVVLSEAEAAGIEEGKYLKIAFRDAGGEIVASYIQRVSEPENGKVLAIFRLNRDLDGILSRRHVSVDIIKSTYKGFRLPANALRVVDSKTGVYVKNGSETRFCEVEVLYRNDDYMIIKEDNTRKDGILLYDNVVVDGA